MQSNLIDLTVQIRAETDKAIGIADEKDFESNKLIWLAKSQIEYTEPDKKGMCEVTLPEWLAHDKGLI